MSSMLDIDPKLVQKRWMRLRLGSWVRLTRAKKPVESGLHFNSSELCVNHTIYCTSRLLQSYNTDLIIIMNIILDFISYSITFYIIFIIVFYLIFYYIFFIFNSILFYIYYVIFIIYIYYLLCYVLYIIYILYVYYIMLNNITFY